MCSVDKHTNKILFFFFSFFFVPTFPAFLLLFPKSPISNLGSSPSCGFSCPQYWPIWILAPSWFRNSKSQLFFFLLRIGIWYISNNGTADLSSSGPEKQLVARERDIPAFYSRPHARSLWSQRGEPPGNYICRIPILMQMSLEMGRGGGRRRRGLLRDSLKQLSMFSLSTLLPFQAFPAAGQLSP